MEHIKQKLYSIAGKIYVPHYLRNNANELLLHISDTPTIAFSAIKRLLTQLRPEYIVHTGDLVDDIKLECKPSAINQYTKQVKRLIDILETSSASQIYISLGNHDDYASVAQWANRSILIRKSEFLTICDHHILVSHYPSEILRSPSSINLFGHDLSLHSTIKDHKIYLNGILNINIINIATKEIFHLPYPLGTNDSRLNKFKAGI